MQNRKTNYSGFADSLAPMECEMNITLVYFSQTGQTLKVAEAMAESLREKKHTVKVLAMRKVKPADIKNCDVLGVGSPCFESQAPTPVLDWLGKWPVLYGKPAFVFATAGGAPGRVLYDLTKMLRGKGGKVMGGFMGRGMVHHPAPCLTGRLPDRPNSDDLADARSFAGAVERHLKSGNAGTMPVSRPDALKPTWGYFQLIGLIAKPFLLRIVLPKPKLDESRCNQCNICARECPVQSIILTPYPVLDGNCIRCYHCQNVCPQKALNESWWYGNLVIWLLYNRIVARLFGDLKPDESIY
jgi:flavodoxin/NAD-dependent dihydropyrimidine dehydrogenase PreA subunit